MTLDRQSDRETVLLSAMPARESVETSGSDESGAETSSIYMDADAIASMMLQGFTSALDVVLNCRGKLQMQGNAFGLEKMRRVSAYLQGVQARLAAERFTEEVR